jgi:hypothetical protein
LCRQTPGVCSCFRENHAPIVTTPPGGRVQSAATYRPMYAELTDRDPFVYETPCFQWAQVGHGLEPLVEERGQDVPEPKPKPRPKEIMSWFGAYAARRAR